MPIAAQRVAFVLGKDAWGNRKMLVVDEGQEYDLDTAAIQYETTDTLWGED